LCKILEYDGNRNIVVYGWGKKSTDESVLAPFFLVWLF